MADDSTTSPLPENVEKKVEITPDANIGIAEVSSAEDKKDTSSESRIVSTAATGINPEKRRKIMSKKNNSNFSAKFRHISL